MAGTGAFGGGFLGDRAGIESLSNALSEVNQTNMQNRQMNMMRQNMMFQQGMAQQEFANTQKQQAFQRGMMPWQIAGQMGGWQMTEPERMQFYPEMVRRIMGGKAGQPAGGPGGQNPMASAMGLPPNAPIGSDVTDIRGGDPQVAGDLAGTALGGVLGSGFGPLGTIGGAALGGTATNYLMNKAFDFGHPSDVESRRALANPSDYSPYATNTPVFPTVTPMAGAMGQALKSTSAKNVVKRNNRAVGAPNMDNAGNTAVTAQALPGPQ